MLVILTVQSANKPQPGSGESPTLPGDLKGAPEVETPKISRRQK